MCVCVCLEMVTENVRMRWRARVCVDWDSQGVQLQSSRGRMGTGRPQGATLHPGAESFWGQDRLASLPPLPSLLGTRGS